MIEFSESNPAPSEQPRTAKPTSEDEPEFVTANSAEADDSADQWLSDELLERVFA